MAALFLDHNVSYGWRFALERAGHTVSTARDRRLMEAEDYDILGIAASQDWIVITHNAKDFRLLHGAWLSWPSFWGIGVPRAHAGILVMPHGLRPVRAAEVVGQVLAVQLKLTDRLFVWRPGHDWTEHVSSMNRLT